MRHLAAFLLATIVLACLALPAGAAAAKKYQVTGVVTELTDTLVVITKTDGERWELKRDMAVATDAALKVGEKVTIQYTMVVGSVEAKPTTKPAG